MRSRCATGMFYRSAVFSFRICPLVHLTIRPPESDSQSESYCAIECDTEKHRKLRDSISYGSGIMDLTEYGRVVHAEMSALCDAARLGRSVKDGVLYCTAFPCHNCTKHILAAGIGKVVYLEPYPKSQARLLHGDEIEIESDAQPSKVAFLPFLGISPFRYRDIFAKGRRKNAAGLAERWCRGQPRPMLDIVYPSYSQNEGWALAPIVGKIQGLHPAE